MPTSVSIGGGGSRRESPLDIILKGLAIAGQGLGVANDIRKLAGPAPGETSELDIAKSGFIPAPAKPAEASPVSGPLKPPTVPGVSEGPVIDSPIVQAAKQRQQEYVIGGKPYVKAADQEKENDRIQHAQDNFTSDIKDSKKMLLAATNARKLINGGAISQEAVKTQIARLTGEVGNLTQNDIDRFGGSSALSAKIDQYFKRLADGSLTKDNRNELSEIINTFDKSARDQINGVGNAYALQLSKVTGLTPEEATERLAISAFSDLNKEMRESKKPETDAEKKARLIKEIQGGG